MRTKIFYLLSFVMLLGIVIWAGGATVSAQTLDTRRFTPPVKLPSDRCETDWNAPLNEAAAETFGLTVEEVVEELHRGAVLKELAANQAELLEFRVAVIEIQSQRIDEAMEAGLIDEAQAAKLKNALPLLAEQLTQNGGGPYWDNGLAGGKRWGVWRDDVAAYLGLSVEALATAMANGQSLGEITEAHGKSVDEVVDILLTQAETAIDQAVAKGILTQAQADKLLKFLEANVTLLVYSNGPCSLDLNDLSLDSLPLQPLINQMRAALRMG